MGHNKRIYQMALTHLPKMGSVFGREVVAKLGGAEVFFEESKERLMSEFEIKAEVVDDVVRSEAVGRAERNADWLEKHDVEVLWFEDPEFPALLNHHLDSPMILYKKGPLKLNETRMVSVVGSRRATEYGLRYTQKFVEELAPYGACIVSGLAHGIDACAHRTALNCGLPTVAVLGHGFDRVYPRNHTGLSQEIATSGALLTEFPPWTPMHPSLFPRRNRIIASLSQATIAMEATRRGGALTTAGFAFEYQRELFALPGTAGLASSEGCNRLIKQQKAHLMESVSDLVEVMGWNARSGRGAHGHKSTAEMQGSLFIELTDEERELYMTIKELKEISIDELARKIGWTIGKINACCVGLELKGAVRSTSAKAYYVDS